MFFKIIFRKILVKYPFFCYDVFIRTKRRDFLDIGQNIRSYRKKLRLSQTQVAKEIGVSRQSLSSWENNKSLPDIYSFMLLSDLFNISIDDLVRNPPMEDLNNPSKPLTFSKSQPILDTQKTA